MELWVGAVVLGLLYAFMSTGVYLTFRVYNFPDITVDGSFTTGAAAAAALVVAGFHPLTALLAALVTGSLAGAATALINTRFKINGLLSGILVMTGLYSINLHLMGRSNIPLLQHTTLFTYLDTVNPGLPGAVWTAAALALVMVLFWLGMSVLLKTDLGMAMRATGENPRMAAANGLNVGLLTILGLALSNGLVGVAGGLVAMYQGFADVTMGVGTVVVGLASVIIGESALRSRSLAAQVLSAILGSVIFRLMIALALYLGMNPIDLKLMTAAFVLLTLVLSQGVLKERKAGLWAGRARRRWVRGAAIGLTAVLAAGVGWWALIPAAPPAGAPAALQDRPLIGVVQLTDNGLLDLTRDGLLAELKALGYVDGVNCRLDMQNGHSDLATINLILDKFVKDGARLVVTISTGATQAAIQKIKDRPVVFATVANPFVIDAGKSDGEHLPNVTGVYGWTPGEKTVALVRRLFPGPLRVGVVWDPSQANTAFNVGVLRQAMEAFPELTFVGATCAGSGEVYQATSSLMAQKVDVLVLPPDNIIYSAFDAVVSAARTRKTPIIINDVERLADGALAALGYDFLSSGEQAARLVDRILKGENPRDIPFERYSRLLTGVNLVAARETGVAIPPDLLAEADLVHPPEGRPGAPPAKALPAQAAAPPARPAPPAAGKRLAIFLFADTAIILDSLRGVQDELGESGALKEFGLEVTVRSAQGEMALGQAIAQDLVRQKFDYVVSLSTIALQLSSQFNKTIPQVFGAVTDPYRTGVAKSKTDHQPNVTGVATFQPIEAVIANARKVFPRAKRIGMAWNPGELSSEACTMLTRQVAPRYGFELVEANVTSPADIMEAVQSLLVKDVDLFFISGDSTMLSAFESVAKVLQKSRVPLLSNSCADIGRGALLSVGPDYYQVGRRAGLMAIRMLRGEAVQDMPIEDFVPETLCLNTAQAAQYGVALPAELLRQAGNLEGGR